LIKVSQAYESAACAVLAAVFGAGCPSSSPPPPQRLLIFSESYQLDAAPFGAIVFTSRDLEVPRSGDLEVTLDWTLPTSNLDLVLTAPDCEGRALLDGACVVMAADRSHAKPAQVRLAQAPPGTLRLWIVGYANVREAGVLSAWLTTR
jgi:hypothetical protein